MCSVIMHWSENSLGIREVIQSQPVISCWGPTFYVHSNHHHRYDTMRTFAGRHALYKNVKRFSLPGPFGTPSMSPAMLAQDQAWV